MAPKVADLSEADNMSVQEINWNPKPVLRTGMDYHDGVAYFSAPFERTEVIPPKKKGDKERRVKIMRTGIVTSKRNMIWYEQEQLDPHNFVINENFLQDKRNRWSLDSIQGWIENGETGPSTEELFDELKAIYEKYVEFADEIYYDLMPLFIMYSYVFRLFDSTGYIHFNGTRASGKSRNLSILNALCFNSVYAASMSSAYMFRRLEGIPGTAILDETEGFDGDRGEDLRRILNNGYKSDGTAARLEKINDRWTPVEYSVYGPKVLASINQLEETIRTRCIIVAMRPTVREIPDFLPNDPKWPQTRDRLYLWAMENTKNIAELVTKWQGPRKTTLAPRIISREWETTAQYIILADYLGGENLAKKIIAWFTEYFSEQQTALDATDRLRATLRALPRVLATVQPHPGFYYSTKEIHEVVSSYMETDATEYFKTRHVTKNLDVLGFKDKIRAKGGLQIKLLEDHVRAEFIQRRVSPFDDDKLWFEGKTNWQAEGRTFEAPSTTREPEPEHWWEALDNEKA